MWIFNHQTQSIHLAMDRRFVLSLQKGKVRRGVKMVVRPYRNNNTQRSRMLQNANKSNFRLFANQALCWDISGAKNVDGSNVIVWSCHNGKNQRWSVSYKSFTKGDIKRDDLTKTPQNYIDSGLKQKNSF